MASEASPQATGKGEEGLRRSPLDACHERHGARLVAFAGWRLPLRYGGELAEHHAVRHAAGVFDLSHMAELEVVGPEAAAALDAALVGWCSAVPVGRARYTVCCGEDGGILDDLVVYRTGAETFVVVANAANRSVVAVALAERAGPFRAEVVDRSDDTALVAVQGPAACRILERVVADPVSGLPTYGCAVLDVAGARALVGRTGYTGEDGFECFLPATAGSAVFEALLEAGAQDGAVPAGLAARDSLRLEAGMPLYGNELTREVTPDEAGLGRLVRDDKPGDYVGRAALARRRAAGARVRLVGLVGEGRRAARHGYPVLDPDGADAATPATSGRSVGEVTSGALSPTLGRPVAMAYVTPDLAAAGRGLAVDVRGEPSPYQVTDLPFYRRPRGGNGATR